MSTIAVRNANQMMISADIRDDGIFVSYADGKSGVVPFGEIEGIDGRASIERLELPNPYEVVLAMTDGSREELPWDLSGGIAMSLLRRGPRRPFRGDSTRWGLGFGSTGRRAGLRRCRWRRKRGSGV